MRNINYFQSCWYVTDIHAAMKKWHDVHGVGPFYYIEKPVIDQFVYRGGTPSTLTITAALAQAGDVQIELIQQHDDLPSAYRDQFTGNQSGFHHIGAMVSDYDAELAHYAAQGYEIAHSGMVGGKRFCYIDTRRDMGHMVEILDENPDMRAMFEMITEASVDWNGADPFRKIA